MYTMYTFLEKVCMMEVRESKKIKKFCGTKKFSSLESHPQQPILRGYTCIHGIHGGGNRLNKHIFHTIFPDTNSLHISLEKVASRVTLSPRGNRSH